MILNIYSIKDVDLDYSSPFFASNDNVALRMFRAVARDKTTQIGQDPNFFSIYRLGTFDSETGFISTLPSPDFIVSANSLLGDGVIDGACS